MQEILEFATHANPTVLLYLCLIIILILIMGKNGIDGLTKLFKRQDLTNYKVEGTKTTLESLDKKLDKIAGNHLHELPEMNQNINKIVESVGAIQKKQNADSERISRIEGFLKIGL